MRSILQPCKLLSGAIPAQVAMASAVASLSSPPAMGVEKSKVCVCVCVGGGGGGWVFVCVLEGGGGCLLVCVYVCMCVDTVENTVQGTSVCIIVFFH